MTTLIEAARQALEALETADEVGFWELQKTAITALRTAIAEAQKPVAWEQFYPDMGKSVQWVGLTDEQINQYDYEYRDLLYDVENMLRENNV